MGHNSACHMVYEVQEQQRKRNLNVSKKKKGIAKEKKKVSRIYVLK